MRRTASVTLILIVSLLTSAANASDMWVLMGHAAAQRAECQYYFWFGEVLLHNLTDQQATVHVADVSSNATIPAGEDITLSPQRTVAIPSKRPFDNDFSNNLWVMHLTTPDAIAAESRIELQSAFCSAAPVLPFFPTNGRMSFTVYGTLRDANASQVFLGTDLGGIPSRNNVAIYNSAPTLANATVELHRACDDTVVSTVAGSIPANSVRQLSLGGVDPTGTCAGTVGTAPAYAGYLVVRVDQPSLAWPSTLASDRDIVVSYGTSANTR